MKARLTLCVAALVLAGCSAQKFVTQSTVHRPMLNGRSWPMDADGHYMQGTTVVFGLVDERGQMNEACVAQSSDYSALDQAALRKMANTRFHPEIKNGVPVRGYARIPVMLYVDRVEHPAPSPVHSVCEPQPISRG